MTKLNQERRDLHRPTEALCDAELDTVSGGRTMALMATMIANLANMRHESLKAVAQNLRA